ncbi:protein O-glucosyltransferase, partial [Skeletonema marinoi]
IVKKGKEVPWSEKLSKVFWRGATTYNEKAGTSRLDYLAQWINYDDNHTDIAFSNVVQMRTDFKREYVKSQYFRKKQSLLEMNRYKYLLSIEGNDVATGLKWMLYSNSVVFMSRPTVATWAMEDLLVPFVHYIPLANDYSNLLEMVKWASEHDEACQEISKRATEFMEHLWLSKQAKRDTRYLQKSLVTSYVNQFDDALCKCAPDTKKKRVNSNGVHQSAEDTSENSTMLVNDTLRLRGSVHSRA